ncbi:MutS-related protein [Candidatus Entotheonella palauensis]|uniref:MutS-related protein n=1 Tax=Candidatus Entotheonella palauensis TaxID=93172 RepID=UPI0015C4DA69|nr:adenylate/guanylate cyclase domain-containing protein [Candidatus Entotheonella palauensis]
MQFFHLLPAVIALLQREGRVTYQALKLEFGLDEAFLDGIRDELIYAKRCAADEDSIVLVWTGMPVTVSPTPPLATAEAEPDDHATSPLPDTPSVPDAERRQLTVMFCDLVGSTDLSGKLDPEDLRDVVRAYQESAAAVIQHFDGHIAQYLGDGLLVYFGYPTAHEDDAQRAVHTGLGIVDAMGSLNLRLEAEHKIRLAVRLGIHTGPVVVGEMGGGDRHEHLALGETPNIAARLEGLAPHNTVVISPVTARLVRNVFDLDELGTFELKGVAEPMAVSQVLGPLATDDAAEEMTGKNFDALVGRDEEIGLLLRRWEQSKAGTGQVVLLSGDAGFGKSSLIDGLRLHVHQEGYTRITFQCTPYTTTSALYPVIVHIQRLLQWEREDSIDTKLSKMENALQPYGLPLADTIPVLAALLSLSVPETRYPPLQLTPQQQRQQTQDVLVALMLEEAERHATLIIWEDLHWADPSTLDLLGLLLDQVPTVPMMAVFAFRPEFSPPWPMQTHMTPIPLNRLEGTQVEALVNRLAGNKTLPSEVVQYIVDKTDGVPLYAEELSKMILESEYLREEDNGYALTGPLDSVEIPATLQDSLMARLDRLPMVREIAQVGAVLGREFGYDMIRILSTEPEDTLQDHLTQLVSNELLYQRGRPPRAKYVFRHALVRDAAYTSLLRRRRQQYHQQVAQQLEAHFSDTVEMQPELLAHHFTEGGHTAQAVAYWQRAGQRASERSAYQEAISHFTQALTLLPELPEAPERTQQELNLQLALAACLLMTKGHGAPEVETAYTRSRTLCQQLGDTLSLFPVLFGLWRFYAVKPELTTNLELGEHLLRLAESAQDPPLLVVAHYALGFSHLMMGDGGKAGQHLHQGTAHYDPQQREADMFRAGQDPGVVCQAYTAWALWLQGYPERSRQHLDKALELAKAIDHPFTLAFAFDVAAILGQLARDARAMAQHAASAAALADEHGFALWLALAHIMQGAAMILQPHGQDSADHALDIMQQGRGAWQAAGADLLAPFVSTLMAEAYQHLGQYDAGQRVLDEAIALMDNTKERWWAAEVYRLKGVLTLHQHGHERAWHEAETHFQQALVMARQQQAKPLELRATVSLCRLWKDCGQPHKARECLAEIYGWFSEGLDTPDLAGSQDAIGGIGAVMETQPTLSLLWPSGAGRAKTWKLQSPCERDLELEHVLSALAQYAPSRTVIKEVANQLCTDPAVITYRQDVLEDLWQHGALADRLETLLPDISALDAYRSSVDRQRSTLEDVTWRLGELEQLVTCVSGLSEVFSQVGGQLRAKGWRMLSDRVAQIAKDEVYLNLTRELPEMLETIRSKASVTIGINLDNRLRPVATTLLSVNDQPFTSSSFIDRLLGRQHTEEYKGIGPLHSVAALEVERNPLGLEPQAQPINPMLVPLFRDLAKVLETVCRPIARTLRRYITLQSGFLAGVSGEMAFYLAAVRLMQQLQAHGLPLCRPEIVPMAERICELRNGYNLNLALHLMDRAKSNGAVVKNDARMDKNGRIFILTGPNQGGKTTYVQMVGLCQILAQLGLWVPATQARMSPVDGIYTHYPIEESSAKATGRFGDEAQRLSDIFTGATRHSLILLNESLASTNSGESLYIAQDLVRILRRMGARAIFATHLHELAADVGALNEQTPGDSRVVSLVASRIENGTDGTQRSYKILPGQPMGRSYAREIASKYGIGYEQLMSRLRQRGVLE